MLSPITLKFLEAVKLNNNVERMHKNHDLYVQERKRFLGLIENLLIDMQKIDSQLNGISAKECIYRFNKDLRFLPDKSHPYKLHFGAFLCSGGKKSSLPGYYIHIQPNNNSLVGGGSRCPNKDEINRIRLHIRKNRDEWNNIIKKSEFKNYFGNIEYKDNIDPTRRAKTKTGKILLEEMGKTMATKIINNPEMLDVLSYRAWTVCHPLSDELILSEKGYSCVIDGFKRMYKMNQFLLSAF